MASIKDIAKRAGVSASTVSFVLNGKADELKISEATQRRVRKIASDLGYRPNIHARSIRSDRPDERTVIALFYAKGTRDSFVGQILKGMLSRKAAESGAMELTLREYGPTEKDDAPAALARAVCHGAIVANLSDEELARLEERPPRFPLVVFNRSSEVLSSVSSIDRLGGRRVAGILGRKGHRRVALVDAEPCNRNLKLIEEGFLEGCAELGIQIAPSIRVKKYMDPEEGEKAGRELLDSPAFSGKSRPTAAFFISDILAFGASLVLRERGLHLPGDLELFGVADSDLSRAMRPHLTVIHADIEEMATRAVVLIGDLLDGRAQAPAQIKMPLSITYRESCPAPRRGPH
jgi:LacI family transcriptional regulator